MRFDRLVIVAAVVSITAGGVWLATGRNAYTKFEVVDRIEVPIEENDPLAAAGFYDSDTKEVIVRRDAFRLGLLPTPKGVFDKHIASVGTVVAPVWLLVLGSWLRRRSAAGRKATA